MQALQKGIDPLIVQLTGFYYAVGIWHNGNATKIRIYLKILVFVFWTFSYPLALIGGSLESDVLLSDSIFLLTLGLTVAVLEFKAVWVFFKQNEILKLINATCIQMPDNKDFTDRVNKKLNILRKCCWTFVAVTAFLVFAISMLSSPLIFRTLPYKIWFPLDYKRSRTAHWIVHCFISLSELYLALMTFLSSIMWYVMLHCSIQYDILGHRLKNLGSGSAPDNPTSSKETDMQNRNWVEREMIGCIQFHKVVDNNVNSVASLFSALFFAQIGLSAFCICGSVYILAVDSSSGLYTVCMGLLFYSTIDIFILMYLGNEIKVSSTKLLYCMFESNWMGQTETFKRTMIILSEVLKRHKLIMVAKLYSLSLETFNSIMRSAYSMFNILNSM